MKQNRDGYESNKCLTTLCYMSKRWFYFCPFLRQIIKISLERFKFKACLCSTPISACVYNSVILNYGKLNVSMEQDV